MQCVDHSSVPGTFLWITGLRFLSWKGLLGFSKKTAILDRIKWNNYPPSPPKQWWRREGAKTRHFGIIEMGKRDDPDVPFILSKIVAGGHDSLGTSKSKHYTPPPPPPTSTPLNFWLGAEWLGANQLEGPPSPRLATHRYMTSYM